MISKKKKNPKCFLCGGESIEQPCLTMVFIVCEECGIIFDHYYKRRKTDRRRKPNGKSKRTKFERRNGNEGQS